MKQLLVKNFFFVTCSLGRKKDVKLSFDDSYIFNVTNIDSFQLVKKYLKICLRLFLQEFVN